MRNAVVVDANDVKDILAKHFNVPSENVIKSQYSYTVIMDKQPNSDPGIRAELIRATPDVVGQTA